MGPRLTLARAAYTPRHVIATAGRRIYRIGVCTPVLDHPRRSWGVRIAARRPNASGWVSCHAIGREDRSPSASFQVESGLYWEPDGGRAISLFDLGVRVGIYGDWREAVDDLGRKYGARISHPVPSPIREEVSPYVRN